MSSSPNPFQAPGADAAQAAPASYKLHSSTSVAIATFLGSMFAGGALMAINYYRLGKANEAVKVLLLTAVGTGIMFAISSVLPERFPGAAIVVPQIIGMKRWAEMAQGLDLANHEKAGGPIASKWAAAGVGFLGLVLVLGIAVVYVLLTGGLDE